MTSTNLSSILLSACILLVPARWAGSAPGRIFDGNPKLIVTMNAWSWGIGGGLRGVWPLFSADSAEIRPDDPISQNVGIDDELGIPAWSWFVTDKKLDWTTETRTVVVMPYGGGHGVRGPDDTARINLGVRKLFRQAEELKMRGADFVFPTLKHYVRARPDRGDTIPKTWDRLVIEEYNRQTGMSFGVDVYSPSVPEFPKTTVSDCEHPNALAHILYNTLWMKAMFLHDGLPVPDDSMRALVDYRRREAESDMGKLTVSFGSGSVPADLGIGDEVTLDVRIDQRLREYGFHLGMLGFHRNQMYQFDLEPSVRYDTVGGAATYTIAVPDSAPPWMYARDTIRTDRMDSLAFYVHDWERGMKRTSRYWSMTPIIERRGASLSTFRGTRSPGAYERSNAHAMRIAGIDASGSLPGKRIVAPGSPLLFVNLLGRSLRASHGAAAPIIARPGFAVSEGGAH